jgi:outer membrane murein-binding lipoprotein Lpp
MDRKTLIVLGAVVVSVLMLLGSLVWSGSAASRLSEIEKAHAEMSRVGGELKGLRARVDSLERKSAAAGGKGLLAFVDQITESIGVKEKLASQKSIPSTSAREEKAELSFEKLSLNEIANLLYRIEAQPVLLLVSRVVMAPSFDEPNLIMLDMTVSLVKAGNEE